MNIRFTKGNDKPNTLTCIRADGSSTWANLGKMPVGHDLTHYAVETTLGLQNSFFGLLAKGYSIQDFALPKEQRTIVVPAEAKQTEFVVGLLQAELSDGAPNPEFFAVLDNACRNANLPLPRHRNPRQLDAIRTRIRELLLQWRSVPPGGALELEFTEALVRA